MALEAFEDGAASARAPTRTRTACSSGNFHAQKAVGGGSLTPDRAALVRDERPPRLKRLSSRSQRTGPRSSRAAAVRPKMGPSMKLDDLLARREGPRHARAGLAKALRGDVGRTRRSHPRARPAPRRNADLCALLKNGTGRRRCSPSRAKPPHILGSRRDTTIPRRHPRSRQECRRRV